MVEEESKTIEYNTGDWSAWQISCAIQVACTGCALVRFPRPHTIEITAPYFPLFFRTYVDILAKQPASSLPQADTVLNIPQRIAGTIQSKIKFAPCS